MDGRGVLGYHCYRIVCNVQVNGESLVGVTNRQAMEAILGCRDHMELLVHRPAAEGVGSEGVAKGVLANIGEQMKTGMGNEKCRVGGGGGRGRQEREEGGKREGGGEERWCGVLKEERDKREEEEIIIIIIFLQMTLIWLHWRRVVMVMASGSIGSYLEWMVSWT